MNKGVCKGTLLLEIVMILMSLTLAPYVTYCSAATTCDEICETISFTKTFSPPLLENDEDNKSYLRVNVAETNSMLTTPGAPQLPVFSKTLSFPVGTTIKKIDVTSSTCKTIKVPGTVKPAPLPEFRWDTSHCMVIKNGGNMEIYSGNRLYPSKLFTYHTGAGINSEGKHVLYLSLQIHPVRYNPVDNELVYVENVDITISYNPPRFLATTGETPVYDLVIIAPSAFTYSLQPLVEHKNNHGVTTNLTTLEYIYATFPGRDKAEKIKYFIKYAVDRWNVAYVLLVGDIKRLPIRATYAYPWKGWGDNIISDLYYADIYDRNFSFCSWDKNNNNRFGEVIYNFTGFPPQILDIDDVDLYPDVYIGRLACKNREEVEIMVDKIINYEENTYNQIWFKRIVLAGGDTFPPGKGAPPFVYEGEITNKKVMQQLPGFEHIKLWASKHNLNALTFNHAINKGVGFVSYAGHGFEHGWATYRPNTLRKKMGLKQPFYLTPFLKGLRNHYKLPIVFLDACLTAKLDYNIKDVERYFPKMVKILKLSSVFIYDPSIYIPCFAWSFLTKRNGGAVAVIGATRPAYTWVDKNGVYAGAGYLDVHFFKAYSEGVSVSQMFTQAQIDYINYVGKDYFTLEEFILLGDPTLRVGGYP